MIHAVFSAAAIADHDGELSVAAALYRQAAAGWKEYGFLRELTLTLAEAGTHNDLIG